jgi:hypothetical protein
MSEMNREVALDPFSIELHAGAEKPSKRAWVEPILTDHMFFAKPSPAAQNITIQVTDRFNNVYKKTFDLHALKGKTLLEASVGD